MPIPLSVYIYERGAGGTPQTSGRADNLRGRLDSYEHSIRGRFGFEAMRCSFAATEQEARDWLRPDHLMRAVEVFGHRGQRVWEGALTEIEVTLGRLVLRLSIEEMANRLIVYYNTSGGAHGGTAVYSNAASIAMYGTRDRSLKLSGTTAAGAAARAQTALNSIAFPKAKGSTESGTGSSDAISVTLIFKGWYALLDAVRTSSTSETLTSRSTQVASLLAAYNAVNAFFSTDTSGIISGLSSDTEWIDPGSSYRNKIENLLAQGDASQQRLFWGVLDGRRLVVRTSAEATPDAITYYESVATGQIVDAYGNVVAPWDVRPDAMVEVRDVLPSRLPAGSVDGPTRKYVDRVSLRISGRDIRITLDPDTVADPLANLEEALTAPLGDGASGASSRSDLIGRAIDTITRPTFEPADNPARYDSDLGVWKPIAGGTGHPNTGIIDLGGGSIQDGVIDLGGDGSINLPTGTINTGNGTVVLDPDNGTISFPGGGGSIDTGGGNISNPGGGDIDLGSGGGIGGPGNSGVTTPDIGGGVAGELAKWLTASSLTSAVAGTDYAAASHTHATGDITGFAEAIDDRVAALLVAGANVTLTYNDAGNTLTIDAAGGGTGAPADATYIVQTASGGLSAEQALGSLATGLLKNTTSTGVLSIAVAGTDYAAASHTHATGDITGLSEAIDDRVAALLVAGTNVTLTYNDAGNTLTIDAELSGTGAPADATYIVQTASSGLSAEQALGSLATGLLKNTTTTGVLSIAVAGTDYAAASHTHAASDITSGILNPARLGSGTASAATVLWGDSTWAAITAGDLPSHTHATGDITGLAEFVEDTVGGLVVAGTGISVSYNDTGGTLTIASTVASGAPTDATYIVKTASSGLSAEFALGSLATGLLKNTTTTGNLSIATAGTDYAAASHTHAASDITSGLLAPARMATGTASASTFLRGDQTWQNLSTISPATIGAAPSDAKYIVQTASSGLSAEQALGSLATGLLKNTTSTGVLSIATAGTDYAAASHTHSGGLTGSGASGRVAIWTGVSTVSSSVDLIFNSSSGELTVGSNIIVGQNANILEGLRVGGTANAVSTGQIATSGIIKAGTFLRTSSDNSWGFNTYSAGSVTTTGFVSISINGTSYQIPARQV